MLDRRINLDTVPVASQYGWTVKEHQTGGIKILKKEAIDWLFFGDYLQKKLEKILAWNNNVHDWLLIHQYLIPKSLIGFKLCFFGTEFEKDGRRLIKVLYYEGNYWTSDFHFLDDPFTREYIVPYFKK